MTLEIVPLVLGPVETNTYLVFDTQSKSAVVIDPAWDGRRIVAQAEQLGCVIQQIWLTHAHFDHIAGVADVIRSLSTSPTVALHSEDMPLWYMQGGAPFFGLRLDPGPEPNLSLTHGQVLHLNNFKFEVRYTPGHTPGHVVFYCAQENLVFCGDVIFMGGIGRTDLPGGSFGKLMQSIREQILTLPDHTRLLSGHGPETTVGAEKFSNPFL